MKTPIFDFVKNYIDADFSRFHMPGHKGVSFLGIEKNDITEIQGADVLYSADTIIKKSEDNASSLFGSAKTFYSTEGSSLCIRAMLSGLTAKSKKPYVLAARNVHKAFIYACAAADIEVDWIYPKSFSHLCSCVVDACDTEAAIKNAKRLPDAVYLTSPDYLGNIADIKGISAVCKKYGILLLVDNAHGAYLNFLSKAQHPLAMGADICCDSAHKTLPVLTGGAYLHISKSCPSEYIDICGRMLKVYASTSPSYLILQSLDLCNKYLSDSYTDRLSACIKKINSIKELITSRGFIIERGEPLKIVINAVKSGCSGTDLYKKLKQHKIIPEFYDGDYVVLMVTPENSDTDFERIQTAFSLLTAKPPIKSQSNTAISPHIRALSIREAVFSAAETVDIEKSLDKICAAPTVSCPPAVPIVISGEVITKTDIKLMEKYGITHIDVVK